MVSSIGTSPFVAPQKAAQSFGRGAPRRLIAPALDRATAVPRQLRPGLRPAGREKLCGTALRAAGGGRIPSRRASPGAYE